MNEDAIEVPEDLKELIPGYVSRRDQDLAQLKSAFQSGDISKVQSISHTIKGNAAGYGFVKLGLIAARMNAHAKKGDLEKPQIEAELHLMAQELDRIKKFLSLK